jgi:hypothetical protein
MSQPKSDAEIDTLDRAAILKAVGPFCDDTYLADVVQGNTRRAYVRALIALLLLPDDISPALERFRLRQHIEAKDQLITALTEAKTVPQLGASGSSNGSTDFHIAALAAKLANAEAEIRGHVAAAELADKNGITAFRSALAAASPCCAEKAVAKEKLANIRKLCDENGCCCDCGRATIHRHDILAIIDAKPGVERA